VERRVGEEDISALLLEVPILGDAEKAILAKQLAKIPARERIHSFDVLKRQSTRRPVTPRPSERPIAAPGDAYPQTPPSSKRNSKASDS